MDISSPIATATSTAKKSERIRRVWTQKEDEFLIQALKELVNTGWKSENGFRCGYLTVLEKSIAQAFPNTDLRGNPHINSKIHVWKRTHGSLLTMLNRSGIGWNETEKRIEATDETWDSFVKTDSSVRTWRYKTWPYFPDWCEIFGNDRATGQHAESFVEALQGVLNMTDDNDIVPEDKIGPNVLLQECEEAGESMSVSNAPSVNKVGSKSKNTKKRKKHSDGEELFIDAINNFTEMSRAAMNEFVKRIGVEYDMVNATKDVFAVLEPIPELVPDEIVVAAALLAENPKQHNLLFKAPQHARLKLVRRLLKED
ncbi:uncharacterized protein LOC142536823 [Primulina tabacum]|uniref:uncharacterized protein LOC142536823 n=1 Tax=Primulina tabacum TaxID=48773 RepID=UPI003F5AC5E2